jgi:tetratricopeptide (TPR) repeat protein
MGRRVALKIMSHQLAASRQAAQRFALESWIGGRLSHPNLIRVFERGTWEDLTFFSMEIVDGGSLADVIKRLKATGRDETLGLEFASREYVHWTIRQAVSAARGLDYAHREGVVHRDIKPMNLLFSRQWDTVKLADFGLAFDAEATRMTTTGQALGTPVYMAPEQVLGKTSEIDARADIYALGVTLFELLTLDLPYPTDSQQMYLNAVLTGNPRRPSTINRRISRDLETVIRKALERAPRDRYPTAAAFAEDLENVLHLRPIVARPPALPARALKWARRRPIHAALAATMALGIPIIAILGLRAAEHARFVRRLEVEDLVSRVRFLGQRHRDRETIEVTTRILELDPGNIIALRERAMAAARIAPAGDEAPGAAALRDRALADADRVIALRPGSSWPHSLRVYLLTEFGRTGEARETEETSARLRAATSPGEEDLYFDGLLAYDRDEYARAVELFTQIIVRRPDAQHAIRQRGSAYEELEEFDRAIQDFRVALGLNPDDVIANYDLGRSLTMSGSPEVGVPYFRRALELDPGFAYGHQGLSDALARIGMRAFVQERSEFALENLRAAADEARKYLAIDSRLPWAHLNLGVALVYQSRLVEQPATGLIDEALGEFQQALALAKEAPKGADEDVYPLALSNICDALIHKGDLEAALERCLESTRLNPGRPDPFYNLAAVYALLGRRDDAFRALDKDFELGDRDHEYLAADGWFQSLRGAPRFKALIRKMKAAGD